MCVFPGCALTIKYCEARACYSAELLAPRQTVIASASQTMIIVILLCSAQQLARAS